MIRRLAPSLLACALGACTPRPPPLEAAPIASPPSAVASHAAPSASAIPAPQDVPDAGAGARPAPKTGFVVRNPDGTCDASYGMYCCPPGALCKPTPPPERVACPPLGVIEPGPSKPETDDYAERRLDGRCYTGPTAARVRRTPCCDERYPSK